MIQIRNDSPCDRDCPERSPTCHGSCERYRQYTARRKDQKRAAAGENVWTRSKVNLANRASRYGKKKQRGVI